MSIAKGKTIKSAVLVNLSENNKRGESPKVSLAGGYTPTLLVIPAAVNLRPFDIIPRLEA